jgi:hypothetical protein
MKESNFELNYITSVDNSLTFNGKEYELRLMVNTTYINSSTYNAQTYSRHGGRYNKWWYQERINSKISYPIQIDSDPIPNDQGDVIRIYVRHGGISMADISKKLLHYIGGQTHIICKNHRLPLIPVPDRIALCKCGKKENIRCPHLDCTAFICQVCISELDENEVYEIEEVLDEHYEDENLSTTSHSTVSSGRISYNSQNASNGSLDSDELSGLFKYKKLPDLIDREELEDFVTNGIPDALGYDSDEGVCGNQDEDEFYIPTTNTGDLPFEIS